VVGTVAAVPEPKSPDHLALGHAIRQLRIDAGICQEELGFRAGLHRNYVGGCERGEINLSFAVMLQLSHALNTSLPELISRYQDKLNAMQREPALIAPRPPEGWSGYRRRSRWARPSPRRARPVDRPVSPPSACRYAVAARSPFTTARSLGC
jgi:transcriptional regulator with XRE-family HTH domain